MRRAIDLADRNGSTDVPLEAAVMVADDANMERRPEAAIEALAQIPPFVVHGSVSPTTRRRSVTKYRVIGERVVDAGMPQERRQIALLCRTQSSILHEHANLCLCMTCGLLSHQAYPQVRRAWYHDATRTWHVRKADGTFEQIEGPTHTWRPSQVR